MKIPEPIDLLSYSKLTQSIEGDTSDNLYKTAATFLLEALDDWPSGNRTEPSDLVVALKKVVGEELTYDRLNAYLKVLPSDNDHTLWRATSISALLELFDFERKCAFDRTCTLEAILKRITRHYQHL